jgi:hypothetical protein
LPAPSGHGDLAEVRAHVLERHGEPAARAESAMTAPGEAACAITLSREAMRLLGEAQGGGDDSDGHLARSAPLSLKRACCGRAGHRVDAGRLARFWV